MSYQKIKSFENAKNANSNELSKTRERIRLRTNFFKKMKILKQKLLRSINLRSIRELDKLFSRATKQELTLKLLGNVPVRKSVITSENISIQQVLLIPLLQKNLVVTFQNLFMSCKISQITFASIMKYQTLVRFRNIFVN